MLLRKQAWNRWTCLNVIGKNWLVGLMAAPQLWKMLFFLPFSSLFSFSSFFFHFFLFQDIRVKHFDFDVKQTLVIHVQVSLLIIETLLQSVQRQTQIMLMTESLQNHSSLFVRICPICFYKVIKGALGEYLLHC